MFLPRHVNFLTGLTLCATLAPPAGARAAEIAIEAPIEAVTVYFQGADVTRNGGAEVTAGTHTFLIEGLPAGIDADRVQVDLNGVPATHGGTEIATDYAADAPSAAGRRLEAEIDAIGAEIGLQEDRVAVQEIRLAAIESAGAAPFNDEASWRARWSALGEDAEAAYALIRGARADIADARRRLEAKRAELADVQGKVRASTTARIGIEAAEAGALRLALTYAVDPAGWSAAYEASADSGADGGVGTLRLTADATLSQQTGEPWQDVKLTLAGERPRAWSAVPELEPWRIDVVTPVPLRAEARMAAAAPAPMQAQAVVAPIGDFAARFVLQRSVDVPQDGTPRRVRLGEIGGPWSPRAVVVPRLTPQVVLEGEVDNTSGGLWPAGDLRIVRDGVGVAQGYLDALPPNATRMLPLGSDPRVEVRYDEDANTKGEDGFFNQQRRVVRGHVIEVTNRHDQSIDLRVLDQVPVPIDERIEVALLDTTTPPDARDADGKAGVLAWNVTLKPGETRTIRVGYKATYPADVTVGGL